MKAAWELIDRMDKGRATIHRKGYVIGEASEETMLDHAQEELNELRETLPNPDIEELADVFGCLVHLAVREGWTMEEVEQAMLKKLALRIKFEEER